MRAALLLLAALAGCGAPPTPSLPTGVQSSEAQLLVAAFARQYGHPVVITTELASPVTMAANGGEANTVGLCVTYSDSRGHIVLLDSVFWSQATDTERWVLMFHELGHCVLGRDHLAAFDDETNCPVSLMWPAVDLPTNCVDTDRRDRTTYVNELFGRDP